MTDLSANTNIGAMAARRYMERNNRMASLATQELASGIVTYDPSRKPSEYAIGARLDATISNLAQATKNANQLIALIQMGAGTLDTMQNVITRMQALTSQANNGALDDPSRAMLDQEYQQLLAQITNLSTFTRWGSTQLFNGSAASLAANGAVTQAFTVNAVTNAFTGTFATGDTQGAIDGTVASATVTANGANFNIAVTFQDGRVFSNTVAAPVANDVLLLKNQADGFSTIGLTYAATVTAFDGTAATFQNLLKQQLGIGTGNTSFGTSSSVAMWAGATVTPGASASAGISSLNYTVSNGIGTFTVTNGLKSASTSVTASASMTETITVGDFTLALNAFNGAANLAQVGVTVTAASTLSISGQIEQHSSDIVTIHFKAVNAASLQLAGTNVATIANAGTANIALNAAAATVSNLAAQLGGTRSQLDFQVDNLKISQQNQSAAKSTYTDTNIADATERLTKFKALSSMSSSVFSQAVQDTQRLAQLLDRIS